jgi:hypothetical protein
MVPLPSATVKSRTNITCLKLSTSIHEPIVLSRLRICLYTVARINYIQYHHCVRLPSGI